MKRLFTLLAAIAFTIQVSNAQTTAMDFNMNDCNGTMHNLYSELDQEKVYWKKVPFPLPREEKPSQPGPLW